VTFFPGFGKMPHIIANAVPLLRASPLIVETLPCAAIETARARVLMRMVDRKFILVFWTFVWFEEHGSLDGNSKLGH
jgi:hypothetical protein